MNRGDFSVGLHVRLATGGPLMTVMAETAGGLWTCSFTQNGVAKQQNFKPADLVPA